MKRLIVVMLMSLVFLSGCILKVHNGDTKPIYPEVGYSNWPKTINTLTPTFRWQADTKASSTYDFAIWDEELGFRMQSKLPIYYKEALPQPEHKIEVPLAPNTSYVWSVRTRSGDKVSAWATYNYYAFAVVAIGWGTNMPYKFKTPEVDEKILESADVKTGQGR
jgi:hypothetical protein